MKKIVLFATLSIVLFSCSKVKDGEFLITGTAKGIENGKSVILQTQDDSGMTTIALDTVKIKDGKFEIKGKIKETAIYNLFLPELKNGLSLIAESGEEVKVELVKDSIQNSKISGTYNNDEFQKFNQEAKVLGKKVQKKMMDFQSKNMAIYQDAQAKKDTVTITRLIKESTDIQKEYTNSFITYAETHPKAFISAFIIDGMFKSPDFDFAKAKKLYTSLDESVKNTKPGKKIKTQLDTFEKQNPAKKK